MHFTHQNYGLVVHIQHLCDGRVGLVKTKK